MGKQKMYSEKLDERKYKYEQMFRNANVGIFIKDLRGRYQLINRAAAVAVGKRIADFTGKTDKEVFGRETAKEIIKKDREVIRSKKAFKYDEIIISKGRKIYFEIIKYPVLDKKGKPVFLCGMARDVTARKRTEQNLQEYARKLAALYNVSKDIDSIKDTNELFSEIVGICCYAIERADPYAIIWLGAEENKKEIKVFRGLNNHREASRYLNRKNIFSAPLKIGGAVEGGIAVGYKKSREKVNAEEKKFIVEIAELLSKEMERCRIKNDLDRMFIEIVKSFSSALDARDKYTVDHSKRISNSCRLICERLNLKGKEMEDIVLGALLHDIGKIGISDGILGKPSRLTPEEFDKVKQHPLISEKILGPIGALQGSMKTIRHHHERYDGTGYPDGLKGNNIPLGARILAVCDSYDAMISERPYRRAMDFKKALNEIRKNSGFQFDPRIAKVMIELVEKGMFR